MVGYTMPAKFARDQERAAGDAGTFIVLYDTYFKRIYNYIRYRVNDPHTADDLTAHVFETLLTHFEQYDPERGPFEPWLFAIARNTVNQQFRRKRFPGIQWEIFTNHPAPGPQPEENVIERETKDELLAALAKLDERARDLVGLKFFARLTNRQIAEMTRLDESHVGVILFRAIARLRCSLAEAGTGRSEDRLDEEMKNGRA
jgi:RNA polymerase sigma-70 factor (ECF subfamily)